MTKGIREFANATFVNQLPTLKEQGPTEFRREVMTLITMAFGISVASAATHYNHAFKTAKAADPKSVEGLGRAADKKGGRKPIHLVNVVKAKSGEVVATGVSRGAAATLIATAAAKGKAKLVVQEPVAVEVVVETAVAETAPATEANVVAINTAPAVETAVQAEALPA